MSNSGKVKCTCGWSWNKSDSSKKDMYVCHECGRDNSNNMKNGGWLDSYADGGTMQEHQENYNDNSISLPEGYVGEGYNTKGRNYSPAWGGQFQMGGSVYPVNYVPEAQMGASIPGAVGFSYARTQSPAPSNGPYAKKTKASAQDGKLIYGSPEYKKAYDENRVAYYDEDSDTYINQELAPIEVAGRAKEKGFWQKYVDKIVEENRGASPLEAAIGVPISAVASLPQLAATYAFTDKMQRPSEAMDIENPYLAMGTDAILDPANLVGAGVLTKEQALARLAASKKSGLLSNAWRLNPKAYQYNLPENTMWRGLGQEGMEDAVSSGVFRSKQDVVPEFYPGTKLRMDKSFGTNPYFTPKFKTAATYGDQYLGEVPRDVANWRQRYKRTNWSQVADKPIPVDKGRLLQKDWLQGYKPIEVPKQNNIKPSFIKQDLSEGNDIKYSFTDDQGNNIGTFSGTKSPKGIYVNGIEVNPEFRRQGIASDIYKNIARELQSKNEGTLFSRSGQHQFTDKDELGRSIAPANKLWENLVNKGEAEKFVEGMSHTYKIKPLKEGGVIKDDMGQWAHPGEITEIDSPYITMQGVPYPVLGISDTGDVQMMYPEEEYEFVGKKVTEFPMAKNGLRQEQKGLQNLDNLTNFTNYNTKQPGGWLDKY